MKRKRQPIIKTEKKISTIDIIIFTRHLATMISAGLPLIQSLETISKGHKKKNMQTLIMKIKNSVANGKDFSDVLKMHPKHFNHLYCSLIRSSEQSGTLDAMLNNIARHLEKNESLKKKIKKAMIYPAVTIASCLIVASLLLIFVVPQFEKLFSSYGAELPAFTQLVLKLSIILQNQWWLILGVLSVFVFGFIHARKNSPTFNEHFDRAALKMILAGPLLQKSIIARTMRTLSTNLAAGIPLVDTLITVSETANNILYRNALLKICADVKKGKSLHAAILSSHLYPHMVVQMVAIGEESGSLEAMLDKIATFYEEDVDNMVSNLSSLLEPLIMILLGVIVGGFVIAMYLPIFKIGSVF